MSINYSVAMRQNPLKKDEPKKAYAYSQYTDIMTLSRFAEHIASHNSKYNRADITAVLIQSVDCMREMLLEGKRIQLGDLGVFSVGIENKPAESLEAFNPAVNITDLNVNWSPGSRFMNLLPDATFNLVTSRKAAKLVLKAVKAGETNVDLTEVSSSTGGGSDTGGGSNTGDGTDTGDGSDPLA